MDDTIVLHNFQDGHDNLYIVRIELVDAKTYRVVASYGRASQSSLTDRPKGSRSTFDSAFRLAKGLADEKTREGYIDMRSYQYMDRCSVDKWRTIMPCLQKIDTSRLAKSTGPTAIAQKSTATSEVAPVEIDEKNLFTGQSRRERRLGI